MPLDKAREDLPEDVWMPIWAWQGRIDLYFLLSRILSSKDAPYIANGSQWVFDRCREIQNNPNGYIDIYAREHYKTTIITFGLTTQDIINDPEKTFGLFSFKRPIAVSFLRQMRLEFESNELLKALYPEVFYDNPRKQSEKWSDEGGFIVRRKNNPREPTVEASGMVDGQPVSRHYDGLIFDDVVTRESCTTDEQMAKVQEAWELALNLGKETGFKRYIGTRYHRFDLYNTIIERGAAIPRIHPCYDQVGTNGDGTPQWGEPVLYTPEYLETKKQEMGPYTFAAQMLCDPVSAETAGFKVSWLNFYDGHPKQERVGKNVYLLCDPASSKKDTADYTVFIVLGLGGDGNYYVLDMVRDKLNLQEKANKFISLHQDWQPLPYGVGYERYGMQADVQFIQHVQDTYGYRFPIQELGGKTRKEDRISRLQGPMSDGKFYFPRHISGVNADGLPCNLVDLFIKEELSAFPFSLHDDILDAMSRIFDMTQTFPKPSGFKQRDIWEGFEDEPTGSWISA